MSEAYDNQSQDMKNMLGDLETEDLERKIQSELTRKDMAIISDTVNELQKQADELTAQQQLQVQQLVEEIQIGNKLIPEYQAIDNTSKAVNKILLRMIQYLDVVAATAKYYEGGDSEAYRGAAYALKMVKTELQNSIDTI